MTIPLTYSEDVSIPDSSLSGGSTGSLLATTSGTFISGNLVTTDTDGNFVDSGGTGGGGSGNMSTSTYDAAAIAQQVLGITAAQTVTNKTIDTASNTIKLGGTTITGKSGNTGVVATTSGTLTSGHTAAFDASGNIVDSGGTGGGGGTSVTYGSVTAAGTAYNLTTTSALLGFGTTTPSLTFGAAGTYIVFARCQLDYAGATTTSARSATVKLTRTNNTAADLTNGSVTWSLDNVSGDSSTLVDGTLVVPYVTTTSGDIVQLWGNISATFTGHLAASAASITYLKIA